MRLFIDTEFNGFGGKLISMGIAAEDGREWYRVMEMTDEPHPWVAQHVLPVLTPPNSVFLANPVDVTDFAASLHKFLRQFQEPEVVADWPADLEHFANLLTFTGMKAGFRLQWGCTMRLLARGVDLFPEVPHNALSDARALRDWYLKEEANGSG
jgi:hypothetical protein